MAKRTKVLSGEGARRYFSALFRSDPDLTPGSARRLTETCLREISELRVRTPLVARRLAAAGQGVATEPACDPALDRPPIGVPDDHEATPGDEEAVASGRGSADGAAGATTAPGVAAAGTTGAATIEPVFDPFAFSLIVALRREGKAALAARLKAIGDPTRLRQIARAQHVGLEPVPAGSDPVLGAATDEVDTLCAAIVAGTERRIAHREAAAS